MRPAEGGGGGRRAGRPRAGGSPRGAAVSRASRRRGGVGPASPLRARGVGEPTGWRVATYSSTTRRRIVPWRSLGSTAFTAFAGTLRQQLGGYAAPEGAGA